MKTYTFADRDSWLQARQGKITGSKLGGIVVKRGTGKKIGFWELCAERLGIPADDESAMARGQRLESDGVDAFMLATGKQVDTSLVLWARDDNESIALSPDGFIGDEEAVEVKCLSSARHIEALVTGEVPSDYEFQVLQYFIVNEKLKTLWLVFYDPRILAKPLFIIEVKREDVQEDVQKYLEYQRQTLVEIDEVVLRLSNF